MAHLKNATKKDIEVKHGGNLFTFKSGEDTLVSDTNPGLVDACKEAGMVDVDGNDHAGSDDGVGSFGEQTNPDDSDAGKVGGEETE